MIKILLPAFMGLFLLAGTASAKSSEPEKGIRFVTSNLDSLLKESGKTGKLVFVDGYTSWCGPCKWMAKNVFTNDTVAAFYNEKFHNLKLNMEKGEGPRVSERYNVTGYPTWLFLDANGEVVHRGIGSMPAQDFIHKLGEVALDPKRNLRGLEKAYKSGERGLGLMKEYLSLLASAGLPTAEVFQVYMAAKAESELSSPNMWPMITGFLDNPDTREFRYLVRHADELSKQHTADSVNLLIYSISANYFQSLIQQDSTGKAFQAGISKLTELKHQELEKAKGWAGICMSMRQGQLQDVLTKGDAFFTGVGQDFAMQQNQAAWWAFETGAKGKELETIDRWMERCLALDHSAANIDTRANIWFKQGKKAEAIALEEKAIELAKQNGEPTEGLTETLNSFKNPKP
jgi:hypothetical protein